MGMSKVRKVLLRLGMIEVEFQDEKEGAAAEEVRVEGAEASAECAGEEETTRAGGEEETAPRA